MCRLLVVEDEIADVDELCELIERHPSASTLVIERCAFSGVEARLCQAPRIDALFVPVNSRGRSGAGIDLIRRLEADHPRPLVVYATTREGYTSSVYLTEHEYLLLSPYSANEVRNAVDKLIGMLGRAQAAPLALRSAGAVHVIDPAQVEYVKSIGRKVLVVLTDGRRLEAYAALSDLEQQLPGTFVRCHKSYVANMEHVRAAQHDALFMVGGDEVPVSQRQFRHVRDALASFTKADLSAMR